MPNIATVLKDEISRIARKEIRAETAVVKKASAQYRKDIAELKGSVKSLNESIIGTKDQPGLCEIQRSHKSAITYLLWVVHTAVVGFIAAFVKWK